MRPAEIPIVYKTEDIVRFCKTQCPNTDQAKEIWQGMASMIWYLIQTTQSKELSQEYQQISQLAREYNIEIPSKKMSSLYNYMKQLSDNEHNFNNQTIVTNDGEQPEFTTRN